MNFTSCPLPHALVKSSWLITEFKEHFVGRRHWLVQTYFDGHRGTLPEKLTLLFSYLLQTDYSRENLLKSNPWCGCCLVFLTRIDLWRVQPMIIKTSAGAYSLRSLNHHSEALHHIQTSQPMEYTELGWKSQTAFVSTIRKNFSEIPFFALSAWGGFSGGFYKYKPKLGWASPR